MRCALWGLTRHPLVGRLCLIIAAAALGITALAANIPPHRLQRPDRRIYESRHCVQDLLDHQRAVQDFTMAILGPDFPVDYFHRGESYLRMGQFELALQDFDYALDKGQPGALSSQNILCLVNCFACIRFAVMEVIMIFDLSVCL